MLLSQNIQPLRAVRTPQQRFASFALVAGLHLAAIAAFVVALNPGLVLPVPPHIIDLTPIPAAPSKPAHPIPPHPVLIDPTTVVVPTPVVSTGDDPGPNTISNTALQGGDVATGASVVLTAAQGIASTHTTPNYPPIDTRLGHEGNVMLRLSINAQGAVVDAVIVHSSGYEGLDRAAAEWVKAHWRYTPAAQGGVPIASSKDVTVTFRLTKG